MPRAKKDKAETAKEKAGPGTGKGTAAAGKKAGRRFQTAEDLKAAVLTYLNMTDASGELATEQGLASALGVSVQTLRKWWNGTDCSDLQETTLWAYGELTDRFQQLVLRGEKNLVSFAIFMLKQKWFSGTPDGGTYADREKDDKGGAVVNINFGANMDASDFK